MSLKESHRGDPLVGTVIADRFEILGPLARGGMGKVYRALQIPLRREVAFKVLDALHDVDEELREDFTRRFMLEASSLAKLNHPNTTVIFDYGEAGDGRYFIAMELLTGRDLRELIAGDGALENDRVIRIGTSIASSLAEAHDHGMIHRDMKPGNVFLTRRGDDHEFVKVLDFGLVKKDKDKAEEDHDYSSTGHMVGTPRYMAPEQIMGDNVTPATDVYGVGATLYHAMAGRPPFDGESRFELMVKATDEMPTPPTLLLPNAGISEALEAVVLKCLNKSPEDRYPDMRSLAAALHACGHTSGAWPMASPGQGSHPPRAPREKAVSGDFSGNLASTSVAKRSGVSLRKRIPDAGTTPAAEQPSASQVTSVSEVAAAAPGGPVSARMMLALAFGALVLSGMAVGLVVMNDLGRDEPAVVRASTPEVTVAAPIPTPAPAAEEAQTAPVVALSQVRLTGEPENAHVVMAGQDLGDAPVTLVIPAGESRQVEVSARGHETRTLTVVGGQETIHVTLDRVRGSRGGRNPPNERARRTDNRDPFAESRQ